MAVFARIVEKGSFSEAARSLGIAKSAVSQHLTSLEEFLDVTLMIRSTRSLALTDEGREYYESCARIVAEAERAQQGVERSRESEKGKVRLTCSYNLGLNFVVPAMAEFRKLHPNIELDLVLDDRILNIVDEGIDLSLRSGWLTDSALYAVTLAPMEMVLCASEAYLAEHGCPSKPSELASHSWVGISGVFNPDRVSLETDTGKT
jgi:DNA-binding transcriptional LysR family regulator